MVSRTLPGLGLKADWGLGEDNWKDENDLNLLTLSVLTQGRVLSIVAAEPGAPAEGAIHILDAAHATQANAIAIYDEAAWKYIAAVEGMTMFNVADSTRYEFKAGAWTAIVAGGGEGGPQLVTLTQAEYDALPVKDPDTYYFTTA